MQRELFRIPLVDWPLYGFGFCVLVGVLAALWTLHRGARRLGLDAEHAVDSAIWMVFVGLIGARIFYCVQFWHLFESRPLLGPLMIWEGGLVIYGGVIAGSVFFLVQQAWRGRPVLPLADAMSPALMVGMGLGRIGCFLNGCCWGKICEAGFPFGVRYPAGSPPVDDSSAYGSLAAHPTQLYESSLCFLIAGILWRSLHSDAPRGTATGLVALLYGVARFTVEDLRGDHHPRPGSMPISQSISLIACSIGLALLWGAWSRSRRRHELRAIPG